MNWTVVVDVVFQAGAWVAAGIVFYGGWLMLSGPRAAKHESSAPALHPHTKHKPAPGLFIVALLVWLVSASPGIAIAGESYELGMAAYNDTRYPEALIHLLTAADTGDARAQEVLGYMYLHGPQSYGQATPRDRAQASHWFERAAASSSEVAQYVLCGLRDQHMSTESARNRSVRLSEFCEREYRRSKKLHF